MSPDRSIFADPTNPQSWNLYIYTLNDPLNLIDPSGHCPDYPDLPPEQPCPDIRIEVIALSEGTQRLIEELRRLEHERLIEEQLLWAQYELNTTANQIKRDYNYQGPPTAGVLHPGSDGAHQAARQAARGIPPEKTPGRVPPKFQPTPEMPPKPIEFPPAGELPSDIFKVKAPWWKVWGYGILKWLGERGSNGLTPILIFDPCVTNPNLKYMGMCGGNGA